MGINAIFPCLCGLFVTFLDFQDPYDCRLSLAASANLKHKCHRGESQLCFKNSILYLTSKLDKNIVSKVVTSIIYTYLILEYLKGTLFFVFPNFVLTVCFNFSVPVFRVGAICFLFLLAIQLPYLWLLWIDFA